MTMPKHFMDNRPNLTNENYDPEEEYAKQRKCRMQDAIDDYLSDERVTSGRVYEEMLSCVDDVIKYHKTAMERAVKLKENMMGHRVNPEFDGIQPSGEHHGKGLLGELEYISKNIPTRY